MADVLCRVDADARTGLGHLQRCLALAAALRAGGRRVMFLAADIAQVRARVEQAGHAFTAVRVDAAGIEDWQQASDTARAHHCGAVVVDSYDVDDKYFQALRRDGLRVVAIDDLALHSFSAHLVVNGGAAARSIRYQSATGDTSFLLGPEYALLGEWFADVPARAVAREVRTILVAVGGGDAGAALRRILDIVDGLAGAFTVTVVLGPFANDSDPIARTCRHAVTVVRAPAQLRELMLSADMAVSAAGQTLYELAATGTPAVGVKLFDNQAANLRALAAAGVVAGAGCITDAGFDAHLSSAISALLKSETARTIMSEAGPRLIDGRGATRVAEAVAALL